ncbi:MAG: type II toxin-antitoxin system RelE/ParE family toxin [Verrucomicrobia bacterium]|nr:type II toxin-antitoxin system RelE/ParE family toxin [Verrucomicrobiota bacterium]
MRDFRILAEVAGDISEAADWYDREGYVGLGDRFTATFYAYVDHVRQNGEIYRPEYSEFRRLLLRPFPYALFFRYHEEILVVTLVAHAARDPRRIRRMLREREA